MQALAVQWEAAGEISANDRDEIIAMVQDAPLQDWRPLIYVIPYAAVSSGSRIEPVNFARRASREPEYIIADLRDGEFEIIEPWPCRN